MAGASCTAAEPGGAAAMAPPRGCRLQVLVGPGALSRRVLGGLLRSPLALTSVIVAGFGSGTAAAGGDFPVSRAPSPVRRSVVDVARSAGVPLRFAGGSEARLADALDGTADCLLVVCYPRRLPRWVWQRPATACWNLHPSLLPAYRGPAPLFWQLRNGERQTGVTLHRVTETLDGGEIIGQVRVPLPRGASAERLNGLLADAGVDLLVGVLGRTAAGAVRGTAQDQRRASYHPAPNPADYRVPTSWPAERAFNFLRGLSGDGGRAVICAGARRLVVQGAVAMTPRAAPAGREVSRGNARVDFADASVVVRLVTETAGEARCALSSDSDGQPWDEPI